MPIRFRCGVCNKLLGIATRKAGSETECPQCGHMIVVPDPNENNEIVDLNEIDELLNEAPSAPLPTEAPTSPPLAPAGPARPSRPIPDQPRPSFQPNVDLVREYKPQPPANPVPVSAKPNPLPPRLSDATSVGNRVGQVVLSTQQTAWLVISVAVMIFGAFVAGFLMASRGR